jgi:hypothetical protein
LSWLPDGKGMLLAGPEMLAVVDVSSGIGTRWVLPAGLSVIHAAVAPSGSALALIATRNRPGQTRQGLFVAPLENGRPLEPGRWASTDRFAPEGAAVWSHTGDRIYFFDESDGRRCLWSCAWNGATLGNPEPVRHFHDRRRYPWNSWLAGDGRLVFALTEAESNVWLIESPP